jgi:hypothetical protein
MLNLLEYNTKRDLVKLNPKKTEIINVSNTSEKIYIRRPGDTVGQRMYSRFSVELNWGHS